MTNIIKVLNAVKGKVLDVANFEKLQHAYKLQRENIEQLKNNNEAIKESNDLLRDKNGSLEKENKELRMLIEDLQSKLDVSKKNGVSQILSEVARAIVCKCLDEDITVFNSKDMLRTLSYSRIAIESAYDELRKLEIIGTGSVNWRKGGVDYCLSQKGKIFALKMKEKASLQP